MFTVSIKADFPESHCDHKRAQYNMLQTLLLEVWNSVRRLSSGQNNKPASEEIGAVPKTYIIFFFKLISLNCANRIKA